MKSELTSKRYSLNDRLRLFHGTVTPTILYAAETWTLTVELENRLRRTQRQMLRMILHAPRRKQNTPTLSRQTQQLTTHYDATFHSPHENGSSASDNDSASTTSHQVTIPPPNENDDDLEPWTEWIKRCTRLVENQMKRLKLEDWVTLQRRRKWRWARKLATKSEFNWETAALHWDPTINPNLNSHRRPGRPKTRWLDDIHKYVQSITPTTFTARDNHITNLTTDTTDANHEIDEGFHNEDEHNNTRAAPRRQPPAPRDNSIWFRLAKDATFWASHEKGYVEQERQQQHSQQ